MSKFDCTCPDGALTDVDPDQCKIDRYPKFAKFFFQKIDATNTFVNGVNGIELAASWSGLFGAGDDTNVVTTPFLSEVIVTESEILEGDENYDGATTADGAGPQTFTGTIVNSNPDQLAALKELACDQNLGVYIVTSNDRILSNKIAATPTHQAIPVSLDTFMVLNGGREGALGSKWKHKIQFKLAESWYDTHDVTAAESGFSYLALTP